jgi:tRNA-uridine 2-sulfurtransferase
MNFARQNMALPRPEINSKAARALGLCSGGLDSMLAGCLLRKQGLDVTWITFETPFFSSAKARQASTLTGIPLIVKNITATYLKMLVNPPCGYGKHMNPCMDCHALMFRLAGAVMQKEGYDFLFSGEVLGQRPMSQTRPSLRYVEKNSGFDGYVLRPLSAQRLAETIPEKEGLVDRSLLLNFTGRTRKPQIQLAKEFGITKYPAPAGGCLLTDARFSERLKDLFDHQPGYEETDLELLKYGRHLRLDETHKIIVGRTKDDNDHICRHYRPAMDILIKTQKIPGPVVLLPHGGPAEIIQKAASICVGYTKAGPEAEVEVLVKTPQGSETFTATGIPPAEVQPYLV